MTTMPTRHNAAIARGQVIPDFTAATPGGGRLRSRDLYLRRNLALVFTHAPGCPACRELLRGLAERQGAIEAEAATVVAVIPASAEAAARLAEEPGLRFPVAIDPDGEIHRRYGVVEPDGRPGAAIVITDRYGTVFESSVAGEDHAMMRADEVPGWLEFVACRCT